MLANVAKMLYLAVSCHNRNKFLYFNHDVYFNHEIYVLKVMMLGKLLLLYILFCITVISMFYVLHFATLNNDNNVNHKYAKNVKLWLHRKLYIRNSELRKIIYSYIT